MSDGNGAFDSMLFLRPGYRLFFVVFPLVIGFGEMAMRVVM